MNNKYNNDINTLLMDRKIVIAYLLFNKAW